MSSELPASPGAAQTSVHQVTIEERGSFCTATCTCGWFAPARRSRDRSRRDATDHLTHPDS